MAQKRKKYEKLPLVTWRGKTQSVLAWGEELGLSYSCLHPRALKGLEPGTEKGQLFAPAKDPEIPDVYFEWRGNQYTLVTAAEYLGMTTMGVYHRWNAGDRGDDLMREKNKKIHKHAATEPLKVAAGWGFKCHQ